MENISGVWASRRDTASRTGTDRKADPESIMRAIERIRNVFMVFFFIFRDGCLSFF